MVIRSVILHLTHTDSKALEYVGKRIDRYCEAKGRVF